MEEVKDIIRRHAEQNKTIVYSKLLEELQ